MPFFTQTNTNDDEILKSLENTRVKKMCQMCQKRCEKNIFSYCCPIKPETSLLQV